MAMSDEAILSDASGYATELVESFKGQGLTAEQYVQSLSDASKIFAKVALILETMVYGNGETLQ